ncbi:MAG: putative integral membrane protein [Francisellaceae bacterium]
MKFIYGLFLLIIFLVVISFSILNSQNVNLNYFLGQINLALSVPVIGAFVIGGVIGLLVGVMKQKVKRKK